MGRDLRLFPDGVPVRFDFVDDAGRGANRIPHPGGEFVRALEYDALQARTARYEAALKEIAHAPEYDGSLCADRDDCPNCFARKALGGRLP